MASPRVSGKRSGSLPRPIGDSASDASVIGFTRTCLAEFEEEPAKHGNDSKALKSAMPQRYPDLGPAVAPDLGAKVNAGQMNWG
ncbi:hypothetical protein [Streptomyces hokutonensis]|uniref:hypothetical protein n=1 Tax=Streptomyces hokutonensis TaxID=1306990 RepID=UPI0037F38D88